MTPSARLPAYRLLGVLLIGCLVTGCAFTRAAFVSYIELDGIKIRQAGFRDVAIIEKTAELELWPGCYQAARSAKTGSLLIPIPPALKKADRSEKVMSNEAFGVSLYAPKARELPEADIRITLHTASGSHQLSFVDTKLNTANYSHTFYRYSLSLECRDVIDARLTIEGLESGNHEMGMNFTEKRRTRVSYQWGFHT